MSTSNPHSRGRADAETLDNHHPQPQENGDVSTRILLDANSQPTCHACEGHIELNARHKCLTVRDGSKAREFAFCDDHCLAAVRSD